MKTVQSYKANQGSRSAPLAIMRANANLFAMPDPKTDGEMDDDNFGSSKPLQPVIPVDVDGSTGAVDPTPVGPPR